MSFKSDKQRKAYFAKKGQNSSKWRKIKETSDSIVWEKRHKDTRQLLMVSKDGNKWLLIRVGQDEMTGLGFGGELLRSENKREVIEYAQRYMNMRMM